MNRISNIFYAIAMVLIYTFNTVHAQVSSKESNLPNLTKELIKLAEKGDVEAQASVGRAYMSGHLELPRNDVEAEKWLLKAANNGNTNAQLDLSKLYYTKIPRTEASLIKSVEWTRKAVGKHNADAEFSLGWAYHHGQGIEKSYSEAFKYFKKAAELGHSEAKFELSLMLFDGQGATQDYVEAYKWMLIYMAGKDPASFQSAVKFRDNISKSMTPTQISLAQSLAKNWKPIVK